MIKHCRRCGENLPDSRTNQRYCPHCADVAEFERREERLKTSPKRKRTLLKARLQMRTKKTRKAVDSITVTVYNLSAQLKPIKVAEQSPTCSPFENFSDCSTEKLDAQRQRKIFFQGVIQMFIQPPLKIDCDGLSQKLIFELADQLRLHFVEVDVFGDEISASKPLSNFHYEWAWQILDKFGVKVT